ncbi:MAG: hypothetical protein C0404_06170 [Verrucomicrobia bacterium]|nr:hypothetical protein [Verrucomicrobiota bacterium]
MLDPATILMALGVALVALLLLRGGCCAGACDSRPAPGRITRSTSSVEADGATIKADVLVLEGHELQDFLEYLESNRAAMPALNRLLDMYKPSRKFPDMSHFRLGPNMFEKIPLDWIIFSNADGGSLIGHGVTTRLHWDLNPGHRPDGWQDAVRVSYQNSHVDLKEPNSLVGLFICIEESSRKHGWAGNLIGEMKAIGRRNKMAALIIPLRPPTRYQKEYAEMPMAEFAALKREDGQYKDHWIRLHVRLGAKVIGISSTSHQHAMSLKDYYTMISPAPVIRSGYTLVQQRDGGWYNVYVDLEREFALINQGCVWVQHPL